MSMKAGMTWLWRWKKFAIAEDQRLGNIADQQRSNILPEMAGEWRRRRCDS
jgi:hypothetical protein